MKWANFQFSLGEILSRLYEIVKSCFHGKRCQKQEMLGAVKGFIEGDQIIVESIISVTSHLSSSARFLRRVLINTAVLVFLSMQDNLSLVL